MKESLRQLSLQRFKQNSGSYIAIGLMCGLFLVMSAMLSLINEFLFLLALPLVSLPMLFACHIASNYLRSNQPITVSAMLHYYFGFFNPKYRSSFRAIRSFLFALAFYIGTSIVAYLILYAVFRNIYGATFTDSFAALVKNYTLNGFTYDDLINALTENNNLLLTFILYVYSISLPVGILYFIYAISFSSLSIYYRDRMMAGTASLLRLAINRTYQSNGRKMRQAWFKLNWPLLVLSLLGSIIGAFIALFIVKNVSYLFVFISLGGVALLFFYLPFYFPTMEVLFEHFQYAFLDGNKKAVEDIIQRIQNSIELSEDEKRSLEDSFKDNREDEE